jgi:uncharacterized protein YegL
MNNTHLYLVLDKSGSMYGKPVLHGANELLEEHKRLAMLARETEQTTDLNNYRVTIVTFSDSMEVVVDNIPMEEAPTLTSQHYDPDGQTDLWNTVWKVVEMATQADTKHILFVLTDGHNTVRTIHTEQEISSEVQRKKDDGMEISIVWVGSNGGRGLGNRVGGTLEATLDYNDAFMLEAIRSSSGAIGRYVSGETQVVEFTDLERDISSGTSSGRTMTESSSQGYHDFHHLPDFLLPRNSQR